MKYPQLEPIGIGSSHPAWRSAGTDLASAERLSRGPDDVVSVIRYVEILRRIGESTRAREVLHSLLPEGRDEPLAALAAGNTFWTQGYTSEADDHYKNAERGYAVAGDRDGVFAARIGLARSARIAYTAGKQVVLEAAIAAGADSADSHLHADLNHERSGWCLLVGDHETAAALAGRAADVHRDAGDRYLLSLADVLRDQFRMSWRVGFGCSVGCPSIIGCVSRS